MAIDEKITQIDDLYLYEIIKNPVLFIEFINNYDRSGGEEIFELTQYQKVLVCDFSSYVSVRQARATGKTVAIVNLLIWVMVFNVFPNDYCVYHIPNKVHLEPVWNGLIKSFRINSFLKQFIMPNSGINSSDYTIKLINHAILMCRIAGQTGTGQAVIGLHTPFEVFDESGYYPFQTFIEAQPTLNTFTPGHRMIVSGVPDGRREKSVNYHCDQENSSYSKHWVTAFENPRFTEKDNQKAIEQYGGKDSDDYIHLILAEHGKPIFALFDRGMFSFSQDPVYKLNLNGSILQENLTEYVSKLATFPGVPDKKFPVILGIDLGYTEPTAIIILYKELPYGRLHFHGRIRLDKVSYPIQERLIDFLDTKFNPSIIGTDAGGVGKPVLQHLQEDKEYFHKNYEKKLIPIDFSSSIVLGINSEGEEIKSKTKPFATTVLQDYANSHKLIFSHTDLEMVAELERMTYSKTPSGDIVYRTMTEKGGKRGEDHFTSALLCATMAYYLQNEFIQSKPEKKKLFKPSWL